MKHRPTIVLTGGGSGGHITPLLSLAHALKAKDPGCKVVYIGLKGEQLEGLQSRYKLFDEVYAIPAGKFRRYHGQSFLAHLIDIRTLLLNIRDIFRVMSGIFRAKRLLARIKPDLVFSKGSFVAVPVGVAAHWQGIPIITHDSDATAGLANRILGRWAKVSATGAAAGNYPYAKDKISYTGIPIDERIKTVSQEQQASYKKRLGINPNRLVVVVGGAGLGSQTINEKVVSISAKLLSHYPDLYLFHITGGQHEDKIKDDYQQALTPKSLERLKVLGFTPDFYLYTGAADLVVTRAGATTIAELALQAKPALLIPAPFLTSGQQLKNAQTLAKTGAAEVLANKASSEDLYKKLDQLLSDPRKRQDMAQRIGATAQPDAANKLAGIILNSAGSD